MDREKFTQVNDCLDNVLGYWDI